MNFLLTIVSLALAFGAIAEPIPNPDATEMSERETSPLEERATTGLSCSDRKPKGVQCGTHAQILTPSIIENFAPVSFTTCRNSCLTNPACISFLFQEDNCVTYNKVLSAQHPLYSEESPAQVWNRRCFSCTYSG